ncbi:MAG: MFS transporter [Pirellulales bacterium]
MVEIGDKPVGATQSASAEDLPVTLPRASSAERNVVWVLWLTYGAFYFCRTNISAAVPGMKQSVAEGGLALSGDEIGWILASLKIAYGLGQLLNGQLSERTSPRVMLALGMFGSAALNVLFGFGAGFLFLLFVWATNGFCQSLGWTPCMRVTANWVPVVRRGKAIGIIGTGYQITLGLTYLIASQSASLLGWRGALWVPAMLLTLAGLFMLFGLREMPPTTISHDVAQRTPGVLPRTSFAENLYLTLYNPALWLLGLALALLNACRYGYIDWGLTHLMETNSLPIDKAGLQFFVIAIGAAAGSYLAGWATDRFFASRRAPVICILMATLGTLSFVYESVVRQGAVGTVVLLVLIGFCIYGPQVLLVGTAPADLAQKGTSAAAAGFVNFLGYMGAATGDVITGYYSSPEHGGWQVAIYIWTGWAFAGALITAILWNTTSRKVGLLPSLIPKLGTVGMMGAAGGALSYGDQPMLLQIATYSAAVILLLTLANRWAALLAILVATAGLLTVFVSLVQAGEGGTWAESAAMVTFGLTMITSLMILVERKDVRCELS